MKRSKLQIFSGVPLLALALSFSACSLQATATPAETEVLAALPTETMTAAPVITADPEPDENIVPDAGVEGSLIIVGLVDQPLGLMEADLRDMDVMQITAAHPESGTTDYEGISLTALLDMAGVQNNASMLLVTAADGYSAEVSLEEVRGCSECLLGFTNTAEKFNLVMPGLPSNFWVKDVVSLTVR